MSVMHAYYCIVGNFYLNLPKIYPIKIAHYTVALGTLVDVDEIIYLYLAVLCHNINLVCCSTA